MLKIKTKFRCIIALYMAVPLFVIAGYAKETPLFLNPDFQSALGISVAACVFLAFCLPYLLGLQWIFLNQLNLIAQNCSNLKQGRYTFFSLPNEPGGDSEENEMLALMRNMNWMIRQIESRETELENRVARRTRALKKTNAELVRARDEARASAKAKTEFLTTMSHEIRTPMNAIINMSDLAMKNSREPLQSEYLGIIHTSSSTLLSIINDILDFSKIDAGKLEIEVIPIRIRDLFEEIADMFKGQMADRPVEFILDIAPSIPGIVHGDPLRLRQVLTNLISNAVKFTQTGEICVRVATAADEADTCAIEFSVRDTGIGIEPSALDTLFTPFTQADGSTTRRFGGTGLGLAISQKLIRLMGGTIRVQSEKNQGSCFSFTLSLKTEQESNPLVLPRQFQAHHVLAAVQNPTAEKIIFTYLRAFGLTVINLREKDSHGTLPGIALLDTALGEERLSRLVDRIRANDPGRKYPILAMGALSATSKAPMPCWADRLVPKPIKQSMLFDTLMEVFAAVLPFQAQSPQKPVVPASTGKELAMTGTSLTDLNILVVEDNPINQKVAMEIFRSAGIVPAIAGSGAQALEMIQTRQFHAVLMDIQMPGMDGYLTTEKIRQSDQDLPVIAMTANAMTEDRDKGRMAGMSAYITKPVCPATLFETLAACLKTSIPLSKQRDRKPEGTCPPMPGIDCETALTRVSLDLLIELVKEFAQTNNALVSDLKQLMNDRPGLIARVHQLKGTSANISATALSRALAGLEGLARERSGPFDPGSQAVGEALNEIEKQMAQVARTAMTLAQEKPDQADAAPGAAIPQDIWDKMAELNDMLSQHSLSAKAFSRELACSLSGTALETLARSLENQIKRFEFARARQTFTRLEADIRNAGHASAPSEPSLERDEPVEEG